MHNAIRSGLSFLSRLFRNGFLCAESILAYEVSIVAVLLYLLMTRANFRSRIVSNEEKRSMWQYLGTTLLSTLMTLQRHWHNFLMFSFHSPSPWIGFQKGTAKKKWSKIWSCSPLWHAPEMRPKSYIHVICLSTGFCAKRANIEIRITLASNPLFASLLEWMNV